MKNIILLTALIISFTTSCTKEDNQQESFMELTTLDSLTHDHATELLRLNILSEYGGVFRQMELYHTEVFEVGMPCDSNITIELTEESLPKYSLQIPIDVSTDCKDAWMTYNNRFYRGAHQEGIHTAESELFAIEALLSDNQVIAGNFEDDVYTYGQSGQRYLLVTKGIAPEIEPTADLLLFFPSCNFDQENVALTEVTKATFRLRLRTIANNGVDPVSNNKTYEGEIQLIDGEWTLTFDDGTITTL